MCALGAEVGADALSKKVCSFNIIHRIDENFEFEKHVLFALYAFILSFSL